MLIAETSQVMSQEGHWTTCGEVRNSRVWSLQYMTEIRIETQSNQIKQCQETKCHKMCFTVQNIVIREI